jgi:hypothetical protein
MSKIQREDSCDFGYSYEERDAYLAQEELNAWHDRVDAEHINRELAIAAVEDRQYRNQQLREIPAELEHMSNTLNGCDWCCGGGDEEWASLMEELTLLT